jgi:hypothetical protein
MNLGPKRTANHKWLLTGSLLLGLIVFLLGCATPPSGSPGDSASRTDLLKQAGFRVYTASTPKKIAYLNTLPLNKIVSNQYQGQSHYLMRTDLNSQQCFVGDNAAYQRYQQLATQAAIAQNQQKVSAQRWDPEALQIYADSQGAGP